MPASALPSLRPAPASPSPALSSSLMSSLTTSITSSQLPDSARPRHGWRFAAMALAAIGLAFAGNARAQSLQELYEAARAFDATYLAAKSLAASAEYRVAQTEAVRRNAPVAFELDTAKGWKVVLVSDDSVIRETMLIEGSPNVKLTVAPAGTTTVIFDGLGRVLDDAQAPLAARVTIDVETKTSFSDARPQRVLIDTAAATGVGIRSCDPKLPSGDPRACPA